LLYFNSQAIILIFQVQGGAGFGSAKKGTTPLFYLLL